MIKRIMCKKLGVDVPQAPLGGWSLAATKGVGPGACSDADRVFNGGLPGFVPVLDM